MCRNAQDATAVQFDSTADRHADAFWLWLIVAAIVWFFAEWWAAAPAAVATAFKISSVLAMLHARSLR